MKKKMGSNYSIVYYSINCFNCEFFFAPIYKTTTTILISPSGVQQLIFTGERNNSIFGGADEIETQIEILKSYSIAQGGAERLPSDIFKNANSEMHMNNNFS